MSDTTIRLSRVRTRQLEERLAKVEDPKRKIAKKFELDFAQVLFGTGISDGEAYTIAERLAQHPIAFASVLHRISNEFLTAVSEDSNEQPKQ
jgi:hypothetical protein